MKDKLMRVMITFGTTLLIFGIIVTLSIETIMQEHATLVQKKPNSITIENNNGRKTIISNTVDISHVTEVGQEYWIEYKKKKLQPLKLVSIKQ